MGSTQIMHNLSQCSTSATKSNYPSSSYEEENCSLCESHLTKAKYIMNTKYGIHTLCSKKCVAYFKKFVFESPKFLEGTGGAISHSQKVDELCYLCLGSFESSQQDENRSISQDIATALCALIGNGLGDAQKFLSEQYCFCCQTVLEQIRAKTFEVTKLKKELCDLRNSVLEMLLLKKSDTEKETFTSRSILQKHGIRIDTHVNESTSSETSSHGSPGCNQEASEKTPLYDGSYHDNEEEIQQKKQDIEKVSSLETSEIEVDPIPILANIKSTQVDSMEVEDSSDSDGKVDHDQDQDAEDELSDSDSVSEFEKSKAAKDLNYTIVNIATENMDMIEHEHEDSSNMNPIEMPRYTNEPDLNADHQELNAEDGNLNESQIPESLELDYFGVENIASFLVIGQDDDDPCSEVDKYPNCTTSGIGQEFFGSEESSESTTLEANELSHHARGSTVAAPELHSTQTQFYSDHCEDSEIEKFCSTEDEVYHNEEPYQEVANNSGAQNVKERKSSGVKRKYRASTSPHHRKRKMQTEYLCKTCNVLRCNWYSLIYHFQSKNHSKQGEYPCPLCDVTLHSLDEFNDHADLEHPGPSPRQNQTESDRKTRKCPKCLKVYYYGGSFDKHITSCGGIRGKRISRKESTPKSKKMKTSNHSSPTPTELSDPLYSAPVQSSNADNNASTATYSSISFESPPSPNVNVTSDASTTIMAIEAEQTTSSTPTPTATIEMEEKIVSPAEVIAPVQLPCRSDNLDKIDSLATTSEVEAETAAERSVTANFPTDISVQTSSPKDVDVSTFLPKLRLKMPPLVPVTSLAQLICNTSPNRNTNMKLTESRSKMPPLALCRTQQHKGELCLVKMQPRCIPVSAIQLPITSKTETDSIAIDGNQVEESGVEGQSQADPAYDVVWMNTE